MQQLWAYSAIAPSHPIPTIVGCATQNNCSNVPNCADLCCTRARSFVSMGYWHLFSVGPFYSLCVEQKVAFLLPFRNKAIQVRNADAFLFLNLCLPTALASISIRLDRPGLSQGVVNPFRMGLPNQTLTFCWGVDTHVSWFLVLGRRTSHGSRG